MHRLLIDQKILSVRERFHVTDEDGLPVYSIEGSLFKVPKQFTVTDSAGRERARVWKQPWSWLNRFHVEVEGVEIAVIRQEWAWFRARYTVDGPGLTVQGNVWDMKFALLRGGQPVGRVQKHIALHDKYAVEIEDQTDELVVLGVVLAIDVAKQQQAAAAAASASS